MYTSTLRKVGGSVMLAVPPAILDMLQLQAGAAVSMSVESGRLIMEPGPKNKYSLQELLEQCDPAATASVEDNLWTASSPEGMELV
jgi:antitoxin ChpS